MTIEDALASALEFEIRVREHYERAAARAPEGEASDFFRLMAEEEQGHVAYLEDRLARCRAGQALGPADLTTAVPRAEWLAEGLRRLESAERGGERAYGVEHLETALRLEQEASEHYRRLVAAVEDPEARALFRRFLEIEDGHTAVVQAQLDYATGTGHFFGIREFTLDG